MNSSNMNATINIRHSFKSEESRTGATQIVEDKSRCRKLILRAYQSQSCYEKWIEHVCKRFAQFGFEVEIISDQQYYVLTFANEWHALQALAFAPHIGYKLVKKRGQRPTGACPVMFKALSILTVRDGKSFKKKRIGKICKGEVVMINKIKSRRARLCLGGWVSLYATNGLQFLRRME